ncbi:hypothetical protein [Allosphingosinicella sp.]|uniref:hypothetical protein n=1 Tax=Allosphingosinicella sp. TaxID=2823234 RepID=UPI002EF1E853
MKRLEKLIAEVVARLDEGENCDEPISEINALSGCSYEAGDFFELHGWTSEEDAAAIAAMGSPPAFHDLTQEEIVTIIEIIGESDEPESRYFLELLEQSFPGSDASDLIYYPYRELTDEERAKELLLRQQLYQAGGAEAVRARQVSLAREVMANSDASPWSVQWAEGILRDGEAVARN